MFSQHRENDRHTHQSSENIKEPLWKLIPEWKELTFLMAGAYDWQQVIALAFLRTAVAGHSGMGSCDLSMALYFHWQSLEHNLGIITGISIVLTGLILFHSLNIQCERRN